MTPINHAAAKTERVIASCTTAEQLAVAEQMVYTFHRTYSLHISRQRYWRQLSNALRRRKRELYPATG